MGYNLGSILGSYVSGSIEGNEDVGGLVGFNKGKITASYSTGSVEGIERVGGLVGAYYSKQTPYIGNAIRGSYSVSSVRGERDTGGLIGLFDRGGVVESYWDRHSTGQETSSRGGMGLSTAEMVGTRETYPDFGSYSGAWEHTEGSYPRLKIWIGRGADNRAGTTDDDYSENLLEGQTNNIPLPPPFRNIQVNVGGSGIVYFSWLTPSSLDYAGVFMEWEDDRGGSGQEEFERKHISYQRDDRGELYSYIVGNRRFLIPGKNYTIRLYAYYAYNERRKISETVRIKIPLKIPPAPTNVVFYEEGEKIRVNWEPGGEEEVDGYLIFLVRGPGDGSSYTTQAEKTEIEIDRESSGLGSNRSDYAILVCSFRSIEPIVIGGSVVESGEFSLGEESLIGVSRAFAMRVVSADVSAQPCDCSPNPSPSPRLTISAPYKACAGDMIPIRIDGENLETNTITVTGGGISHSLGPNKSFMGTLHNQVGVFTLTATAGATSASTTIKISNCDSNENGKNGDDNSDGGVGGGDTYDGNGSDENNQSPLLTISVSPSTIVAGKTSTITVTGENIQGNITLTTTGGTLTPTWLPSNGGEATFTASSPGTYIVAALAGETTVSNTVMVIPKTQSTGSFPTNKTFEISPKDPDIFDLGCVLTFQTNSSADEISMTICNTMINRQHTKGMGGKGTPIDYTFMPNEHYTIKDQGFTYIGGNRYKKYKLAWKEEKKKAIGGTLKIQVGSDPPLEWEIKGKNPGKQTVKNYISNLSRSNSNMSEKKLLYAIAYNESGGSWDQFKSDGRPLLNKKRDGEEGDGGVGIMQLTFLPLVNCETIWNWKKNVEKGVGAFRGNRSSSTKRWNNLKSTLTNGYKGQTTSIEDFAINYIKTNPQMANIRALLMGEKVPPTEWPIIIQNIQSYNGLGGVLTRTYITVGTNTIRVQSCWAYDDEENRYIFDANVNEYVKKIDQSLPDACQEE